MIGQNHHLRRLRDVNGPVLWCARKGAFTSVFPQNAYGKDFQDGSLSRESRKDPTGNGRADPSGIRTASRSALERSRGRVFITRSVRRFRRQLRVGRVRRLHACEVTGKGPVPLKPGRLLHLKFGRPFSGLSEPFAPSLHGVSEAVVIIRVKTSASCRGIQHGDSRAYPPFSYGYEQEEVRFGGNQQGR